MVERLEPSSKLSEKYGTLGVKIITKNYNR